MTTLPNKELLRPDEVAKYFSVHKTTIYRWINEGLLPSKKIGNKSVRITRKSVLSFIRPA